MVDFNFPGGLKHSRQKLVNGILGFRDKKSKKALKRLRKKADFVIEVEWADGNVTFEPGEWNTETSCYETLVSDMSFFAKGKGAEPKSLGNMQFVRVRADVACPISTEACILNNRLNRDKAEKQLASDGGVIDYVADITTPKGYDGQAFSLEEGADYAPNPVDPKDVNRAVEAAKTSEAQRNDVKPVLMGVLLGAAIIVGAIGIFWFLGKLGGSGGGSVVPIGGMMAGWFL